MLTRRNTHQELFRARPLFGIRHLASAIREGQRQRWRRLATCATLAEVCPPPIRAVPRVARRPVRSSKSAAARGVVAAILAAALACAAAADAGDSLTRGRILFLRCASCHAITPAPAAKIGPNLQGVVGRKVASLPGYAYSAALRSQDFVWDAAHLDRWIRNPNEVAPGTLMAFAGMADASDRRALIEFLQAQHVADGGARAGEAKAGEAQAGSARP